MDEDNNKEQSGYGAVGDAVSKLDGDKRKAFVQGFMGKSGDDPEQKKQAMLRRLQGAS